MDDVRGHSLWPTVGKTRRWQHLTGIVAAACLAIGLVALADGLQATMRQPANELEFIPGEIMALSGPAALKNPLASDLRIRFEPPSAPFVFELEGFFTGYWFGSGMWRGELRCAADAPAGSYGLDLGFRGAPAQNTQKYKLVVFADAADRRGASRSLLRHWGDLNPFVVAAFFGALGVLGGCLNFWLGCRLARMLQCLGLAEIYARHHSHLLCLSPKAQAPGTICAVLDGKGNPWGEAVVDAWIKGKIRLLWPETTPLPRDALVQLRPPRPTGHAVLENGRPG